MLTAPTGTEAISRERDRSERVNLLNGVTHRDSIPGDLRS